MSGSKFLVAKTGHDGLFRTTSINNNSDSSFDLHNVSSYVCDKLSFLSVPIGWLKCWQFYAAVGVGLVLLKRRCYNKHPIYHIKKSLKGSVYVITGASAGIGLETVKELAKYGAVIHCLCRDIPKAQRVLGPLQVKYGRENVQIHQVDLCDLSSISRFATKFLATTSPIHCLINNAGLITFSRRFTKDGFESTFQSNHLGHFLLTKLLLDRIKESRPSRIVVLSSGGHAMVQPGEFDMSDLNYRIRPFPDDGVQPYCWTKFENILFTRELARRLYKQGVTVNAVHPGVVSTEFFRDWSVWNMVRKPRYLIMFMLAPFLFKTPYQGAQTTLYCAVADELEHVTGQYFADCKPAAATAAVLDDQLAEDFWEESEKMIAHKF